MTADAATARSRDGEAGVPSAWSRRLSARADAIWWMVIGFVGAWLFSRSQGRWLDPILDIGRDLYIPARILLGERLYVDFQYYYDVDEPSIGLGFMYTW